MRRGIFLCKKKKLVSKSGSLNNSLKHVKCLRTWGIRRGLLLTDQEFWQEQRKFVLRHLREFGFGRRTMGGLVEDEASELVKYFKNKVMEGNNILPMRDAFGVCVLNTLWTMLAGIRYR